MRMGRLLKIILAAIIRGSAAEDKKKSGVPSPSFATHVQQKWEPVLR
jgi:hypothetical protein